MMVDIRTIDDVIAIEPKIKGILKKAKKVKHATWYDYEKYKRFLCPLVGFYSPRKELRTCSAYEVTIRQLVSTLKL